MFERDARDGRSLNPTVYGPAPPLGQTYRSSPYPGA